ncbi:GH25 family lysozyme [Brochothrix campestris]|uniref:Glycosyl hydrolases 25 family protein n=1 Tax=Brochothrix campestris FSL F6-1037 TaxID=1265861 RepID=W7CQR4_9LIST|nr:GH25 family lysozyme [Brochothrix campestris]EUJ41989.1 glycosyl hydrolases 25 family protein [Brochothrix campestris FSL F6-1037]
MNKTIKLLTAGVLATGLFLGSALTVSANDIKNPKIADVSEWQGNINWSLAKDDLNMAIIRAQYGTNYKDKYLDRNQSEAIKHDVPFGTYAYARYINAADAKTEARALYNRTSKSAKFYVIDVEEFTVTSGTMREATNAFVKELRSLTDKKIGLYVGNHTYTQFNLDTSKFDFVWIPAYRTAAPDHKHDIWQYTDGGQVKGITGGVDLNKLTNDAKPLSYYVGKTEANEQANDYTEGGYSVGQSVKLLNKATHYHTGQKIDASVKNKNYKVLETKVIAQSHSKQAVLLSGINSWVLAQDVAKVTAAANDNYYNTNPKRVTLKKASTLRKKNAQNGADWDKQSNQVASFKKGTEFVITGIKKSSGGTPRLVTQSGHLLTANKTYVQQTTTTVAKQYYTVKSGDNVEFIAKKHATTTAKIKSLNKLSDVNKIYVDQKLQVK